MLDKILVLDVLDEALKTGGDFAEVFFEDKITNNLLMGNNKIEIQHLQDLPSGEYVISIKQNDDVVSQKLIKIK